MTIEEYVEIEWEDTSFSHEFGTQYQGYWRGLIADDCPFSEDELLGMKITHPYPINEWDTETVTLTYNIETGEFEG